MSVYTELAAQAKTEGWNAGQWVTAVRRQLMLDSMPECERKEFLAERAGRRRRKPVEPAPLEGATLIVVKAEKLDRCLSPRQAARFLGVRQADVAKWIRTGELQAVLLGSGKARRLRISPESLAAFLAGRAARKPTRRRQRDDIDPRVRLALDEIE